MLCLGEPSAANYTPCKIAYTASLQLHHAVLCWAGIAAAAVTAAATGAMKLMQCQLQLRLQMQPHLQPPRSLLHEPPQKLQRCAALQSAMQTAHIVLMLAVMLRPCCR